MGVASAWLILDPGKCVLIDKGFGEPIVCNDGVTIAKELELKDPTENLGARMIREAAERMAQEVGDGTTTATLLAHAIFAEGVRNVSAGASAIDLKRGIDRGVRAAVAVLRGLSRPVKTRLEKAQVATISAHNDAAMGELVADAVERVGGEGVISVEEAKGTETRLEVVEGMQFDRGYLSPYFVTDPDRMECVLQRPLILVTDRKIAVMKDFLPILEEIVKVGRPLLIVAEDVEGDALATLVVNKLRAALQCAAVKAPGYGDRRKAMLEDIAVLTGGEVASEELGLKLEHLTPAHLGSARRVVVARETTTIVEGAGDREVIQGRIDQLRKQIKEEKSDYDREKLQERLARLSGGVAVIHVGAPTEAELKSRKEAFEDGRRERRKGRGGHLGSPQGGDPIRRLPESRNRRVLSIDGVWVVPSQSHALAGQDGLRVSSVSSIDGGCHEGSGSDGKGALNLPRRRGAHDCCTRHVGARHRGRADRRCRGEARRDHHRPRHLHGRLLHGRVAPLDAHQ